MKKAILTMACVAIFAFAMSSCADKAQCWEVSGSYKLLGNEITIPAFYVYGTSEDVDALVKNDFNFNGLTFTKKKASKEKSECLGAAK